MRGWRVALLTAILILSACTGDGEPSPQRRRAAYETIDCPAEVSRRVLADIECGVLTAPAHRDAGGGNLRLFVTTFHPEGPPADDPVLWFGGDLGVAPDYELIGSQLDGLGRDVIMLDARGSGRSEPSLACPEVEALAHPPVSEPLDSDRIRTEFVDAIAACRERLVSGGVDLTAFDLREMAADAEDLRVALDIHEWNIMATGTTSRIALEYLRRYPGNVRAAVLDSPEWPSIDPFVESIEATRHAISELVAACADDPVCRRVAPDLEADIEALAVRLDSNPNEEDVESGHVSFDDGWFRVWLRARLSFFRPPDTFVPVVVSALADAHVGAENLEADRITRRQLCQGFIPNCWTHLVQSFGMYQSVMCRDVLPFTDHGDLEALAGDQPGFDDAFVRSPFLESCAAWDAGRGDGVVATPVRTDVPTLVIVGLFDPFGMPPYAEEALTNFANGTLLVSPENGHQVTGTDTDPDTCIVGIRNAWVEDPTALPDTSCVEGLGLGFEADLKNVIREGIG